MAKTIKVRIAVAVDANGDYNAAGFTNRGDRKQGRKRHSLYVEEVAVGEMDAVGSVVVHWIEAELPLPESVTVKGKVKS